MRRVRDPWTVVQPAWVEVLRHAFDTPPFPRAADVLVWLQANVGREDIALFEFWRGGGRISAFLLADGGTSLWRPAPLVLHLHAPRDPEARHALAGAVTEWLREAGHDHLWALNHSHLPDGAYCEAFRPEAVGSVRCSLVEFRFPRG